MAFEFDLRELSKELQLLDKKVSGTIIEKALNEGGDIAKGQLKAEIRARVYDTGELFDSIDKTKCYIKANGTGYIDVGSNSKDEDVRARNWYQEYGHSTMLGKKHNIRAAQKSIPKSLDAMAKVISKELCK